MPFEIMHFRGAQDILKEKKMVKEIIATIQYLDDVLYGSTYRRELLRQALEEMDWRQNGDLNILEGRRYNYKGFRKRVAMDGSFSSYEYIQDALFRLQVGFDKKKIDMGLVLVTAERSEKSPLGSTRNLIEQEIELLYPTISLPVTIALFDLGRRGLYADEAAKSVIGEEQDKENDQFPNDLDDVPAIKKTVFIDPRLTEDYLNNDPEPEKQTGRKKKTRMKAEASVNPAQNETFQAAVNQ